MLFTPSRPRSNTFSGRAAIVAVAACATLASACGGYDIEEAPCGTEGAAPCSGTVLWVKTLGGDEPKPIIEPNSPTWGEQVRALAVDAKDGVVAVGLANSGLYGNYTGGADLLVARYNASGGVLVPSRIVGAESVYADGVGVDPDDNILVAGTLQGAFSLDNCPLDTNGLDGYLALLDPQSFCTAIRAFPGVDRQEVRALGVGPDGLAVVAGTFGQQVDLDGEIIMAPDGPDSFVAALDQARVIRWKAIVRSPGPAEITSLAVLPGGDVVIAGSFYGSITIDEEMPQAGGGFGDVFLARLSGSDGSLKWLQTYGNIASQAPTSVATGPGGQIALVGRFHGTVKFSEVQLDSPEQAPDDAFVAYLDSNGKASWAMKLGGANKQNANAVAIDDAGDVLVGGSFVERIEMGSKTYEATTAADTAEEAFAVKLGAKDGAPVWFHALGGPDHQAAHAVTFARDGAAYVGGTFRGTMTGGGEMVESLDRRRGFVFKIAP